jgi:hypothetical protein
MGVTAHGWVNQNPEMLPEDVVTFLGKIKVPGSIWFYYVWANNVHKHQQPEYRWEYFYRSSSIPKKIMTKY